MLWRWEVSDVCFFGSSRVKCYGVKRLSFKTWFRAEMSDENGEKQ